MSLGENILIGMLKKLLPEQGDHRITWRRETDGDYNVLVISICETSLSLADPPPPMIAQIQIATRK